MNINTHKISTNEFVLLMALITSLIALSIDAIMPAFPMMAKDLHVIRNNSIQSVIVYIFLGLAIGQLLFGPLSDIVGRKIPVITGLIIYITGTLLALFSHHLDVMIVARIMEGIGLSGPRTASIALVRDLYKGDNMARIMSFIMMIFIMVPIIAPTIGQFILFFAGWRAIFCLLIVVACIDLVWFAVRQPETLPPDKRFSFSLNKLWFSMKEVLKNRQALGYTVAGGVINGAFIGYLSLSQPIFQGAYHLGSTFPIFFALLAIAIGSASFFNGKLVVRFGAQKMTHYAAIMFTVCSAIFFLVVQMANGKPQLWLLVVFMLIILFSVGIMFGNQMALAMGSIGHVAGMGAAIVGASSTFIGAGIGMVIVHSFHQAVTPLAIAFALCGILTIIAQYVARTTLNSSN
ncbi:MAG: multidrug effflux MFS transporter [Endozoicomonas sp. (ex Botrylloides leachii)]|nr:multidrug effflux MFS transporter [Endozoicomonas sp. (ex Botrylloides leachii)]